MIVLSQTGMPGAVTACRRHPRTILVDQSNCLAIISLHAPVKVYLTLISMTHIHGIPTCGAQSQSSVMK